MFSYVFNILNFFHTFHMFSLFSEVLRSHPENPAGVARDMFCHHVSSRFLLVTKCCHDVLSRCVLSGSFAMMFHHDVLSLSLISSVLFEMNDALTALSEFLKFMMLFLRCEAFSNPSPFQNIICNLDITIHYSFPSCFFHPLPSLRGLHVLLKLRSTNRYMT